MFERVLSINNNYAKVKISNNFNNDILNYNVIFEDTDKKILGQIDEIVNGEANISFLGEYRDNKFFSGIIRKPTLLSNVRIINQQELNELVGNNDNKAMPLGVSPLYNNFPIKVNINDMFSNHTVVLGNSGTGKTYGVAKIIQNLFGMKDKIPFNSNIFIFNTSHEYDFAFRDINKINNNFNYKLYSVNNNDSSSNMIKLPLWLLDVDDFANLLDVTDYVQIGIIEKMLGYVSVLSKNDEESKKYKNHFIAKAINSILYSNQINTKIREQIFNILNECKTKEINLDVKVPGVGYTKELRKCFDIDKNGDFVERTLVFKYIQSFIDNNIKLNREYEPIYFTLEQLENALDFVLISDGILLNDKYYNEAMDIKVKLHSLSNSSNRKFFDVPNFMNTDQFINSLLITNNNSRAQIINFVLDEIDDRFAKSLVKILCRMLFKFNKRRKTNGMMPFHIILEEAHRYVQDDNDGELLGYNIFERIAKDGRNFGIIMNLITYMPMKLSKNVLSQCSNFIIFRFNHMSEIEYITKIVPNISFDVIERTKSLQTGTCIAFGKIMKVPMIVKMEIPNPEPKGDSAYIYDKWIVDFNK